jgi:hypothetical protein
VDQAPTVAYNRPLLFWSVLRTPQAFAGKARFVRKDIRQLVLSILPQGRVTEAWAGYAYCRICKEQLGSKDLAGFGFAWPERAEHYVEKHEVWTPDLDDFVKAVQSVSIGRLGNLSRKSI